MKKLRRDENRRPFDVAVTFMLSLNFSITELLERKQYLKNRAAELYIED